MRQQLQWLETWYMGLPFRERILVSAAAVLVMALAFESLWWGPEREQAAHAGERIESLEAQKTTLAAELERLEQREALDPDAAVREQLDEVGRRIAALDERLRGQTLQILTPEQMPAVLRDLIGTVRGLRIVGIRSQPPERLVESADDNLPVLYRHGMVVELRGDYLALLDCVRALEALPWRLYWAGLEVQADGFEPSRFRLHVYTVSLREEWIRV